VTDSCNYGDEPAGSDTMELVRSYLPLYPPTVIVTPTL
jgi:hypothetical protein